MQEYPNTETRRGNPSWLPSEDLFAREGGSLRGSIARGFNLLAR